MANSYVSWLRNLWSKLCFGLLAMSGRAPRTKEPVPTLVANGRPDSDSKLVVQNIKEATGASEEEILDMLKQCQYDADETTSRLLESMSMASQLCCPFGSIAGACDLTWELWCRSIFCFCSEEEATKETGEVGSGDGRLGCFCLVSSCIPIFDYVPQKEEERKKESAKVVEVRRQTGGSSSRSHRGRGDRGEGRDRRGDERPARGGYSCNWCGNFHV
jgi:GBF-interacting protein 1 N-terminal